MLEDFYAPLYTPYICMLTYFYAHIRHIYVYILRRPCTPYIYFLISTLTQLYYFTAFYAHIYIYIYIHVYIFLLLYIYTCLHNSMPIYLYMSKYLNDYIPMHGYIR